jgi:hypothetical protein
MVGAVTLVAGWIAAVARTRLRLAGFATAAVFVIGSSAHAQAWREYRYSGFAIQFPAEPIIETVTYTTTAGVKADARLYSAKPDGALYRVTVADLSDLNLSEARALSEAIVSLVADGEVVVDVPHRVNRVLGRQLSIVRHDGSRSAIAAFYRGRRLYLIEGTILATNDDMMSSDGVRFQQSLRFILNNARGDFLCDLRRAPRNLVDGAR